MDTTQIVAAIFGDPVTRTAAIVPIVIALTEKIKPVLPEPDRQAFLVVIVLSCTLHLLASAIARSGESPPRAVAMALLTGLITSYLAAVAYDRGVKPVARRLGRSGSQKSAERGARRRQLDEG